MKEFFYLIAGVLVAIIFAVGANIALGQESPVPCEAWRDGPLIVIDPTTCPEVTPSTTSTTSTTSPPDSTSSTSAPATTSPPTTAPPTSAPETTAAPTTTVSTSTTTAPEGVAFTEGFATAAGFYDRFWTYTGNYCTAAYPPDCRPEEIDSSVKQFPGSHNLACDPPPTNRTVIVGNHADLFWYCAPGGPTTGHVMTGLNTSGYAIFGFTPRRTFTNVSSVCWDVSLADLGGGKWFNVALVNEATLESRPNLNPTAAAELEGPYRLDYVGPDFSDEGGPGDFNIQDLAGVFGVKQFRGTISMYSGNSFFAEWGDSWTAGTDQLTRYEHCFIDNGNGTVTLTQERATGVESFTAAGSFPDGPVYVLFLDDNYDADKHGGTGLYTWHWDQVEIREG